MLRNDFDGNDTAQTPNKQFVQCTERHMDISGNLL